jgi:hypothetical protein
MQLSSSPYRHNEGDADSIAPSTLDRTLFERLSCIGDATAAVRL